MIKSIQQFQEKGIKNSEEVFVNYSGDMTKFAEMVYGVRDEVINLGLSMIAEELEFYDESLRKKKELRTDWYIVRRDETTLLTSMGNVTYQKTLFKNSYSKFTLSILSTVEIFIIPAGMIGTTIADVRRLG